MEECQKNGKPIHRKGKDTIGERMKKKLTNKADWFKQKRKQQDDQTHESGPSRKKHKDSHIDQQ